MARPLFLNSGVPERLRSARLALGLTQEDLNFRAGLSQNTIGSIERGRTTNPTILVILRLAEALEVSPGWLAFGE